MGLDGETDSHAKDASREKPILKKTPGSHEAKTNDHSRGIAGYKNRFGVGQQEPNEACGENRRVLRSEVPHQVGGQDEDNGGQTEPERLRNSQRQLGEWGDEEECGGQIYKQRDA